MSKPNAQYIRLSQLLSDTVPVDLVTELDYNGAAPSSQSAPINAYIQQALEKLPLKLVADIGIGIITKLTTTQAHVDIEGCGWDTGFLSLDNSVASCVLTNGGSIPTPGSGTPPAQDNNFRLANIKLDGNRRHNGKVDGSGNWMLPLYLVNLAKVRLRDVWIYDAPTFSALLINCSDIVVDGCRFETATQVNCDGLHIDGPASNIRISNSYFKTGDDAIALNCPEGYGGSIAQATITNCIFDGVFVAVRGYTDGSTTIQRLVVSNCVGRALNQFGTGGDAVFKLGESGAAPNGYVGVRDFQASNCTFQSDGDIMLLLQTVGAVSFSGFIWDSPSGVQRWVHMIDSQAIGSLTFTNCRIRRTTSGSAASYLLAQPGSNPSSIDYMEINGFAVEDEHGQSYAAIPYLIDMANLTITELRIVALDPTHITALVNPTTGFTGITKISGPGVAATGFLIPDAIMDIGCPYFSANTGPGSLCIKKTFAGAPTVLVA